MRLIFFFIRSIITLIRHDANEMTVPYSRFIESLRSTTTVLQRSRLSLSSHRPRFFNSTSTRNSFHNQVPPVAHKLLFLVPTLKSTKLIMEQLVDSYTALVSRVPERLAKALDPAVKKLQVIATILTDFALK